MTGGQFNSGRWLRTFSAVIAAFALTGCIETDNFGFLTPSDTGATGAASGGATAQTGTVEQDVERPDIFEVTDQGLWDGRLSLGGIWVAHPDVTGPERVIIRNPANGKSVMGALFRRERDNPGPLLQISSDAAEALGILAGAPTEISAVVLRREEVIVEVPKAENPVVSELQAPVNVEETSLDPVAGAAAAIAAAEAVMPEIDVDLPAAAPVAAIEAPQADAPTPAAEPAQAVEQASAPLSGPLVQIGVFSIQGNADGAAAKLRSANIPVSILSQQAGGRTVWRVVAGPFDNVDARAAALVQIKELGFIDAFGFEG